MRLKHCDLLVSVVVCNSCETAWSWQPESTSPSALMLSCLTTVLLHIACISNVEQRRMKKRAWDKYLIKPFLFFFIYSDRERQRLHSGHSEEAERQICAADFHLLGADDKEESRRHASIHRQTSTKVSWTFLLREKFIEASTFWKWWHEC